MLLTKASEYALLSVVLIARQNDPADVDTLSKRLGISRSFLAKILQALARESVLKSYKGAKGGFTLNGKPEDISVRVIIEAAEKKPLTVFECAPDTSFCPNNKGDFCIIWPFLNKFQTRIDEFLDDLTLVDIL